MQNQGKRPFNKIDYCYEKRQQRISIKKGTEQETASLNINLKTIVKNYLNEYMENCQVHAQIIIINDYIKNDKANFKSTKKLFGADNEGINHQIHERIRIFMAQNYSRSNLVKRILSNEKMDFKSKIIFIKFLERIRQSALTPNLHNSWKKKI